MLIHLARSTPPSLITESPKYFDNDVCHCFVLTTAVDRANSAWQQAQLSLSRRGLWLCRLSDHSSACYIASGMSGMCSGSHQHLLSSIEEFDEHVLSAEAITLGAIVDTACHQKVLPNKLKDYQFIQLFSNSFLPDRVRLLSVSSPDATAWLSSAPSPSLNLSSEFHAALQWWLGIGIT